jgi:hypothetical protein
MVVDEEDARATTAWSTRPETLFPDDDDNITPPRGRALRWVLGGLVVAALGGGVAFAAVLRSRREHSDVEPPLARSRVTASKQFNAAPPAAAPKVDERSEAPKTAAAKVVETPQESWWTPPSDPSESVDALAYAFLLDETNLGDVFDADLQPIRGARKLFEDHQPRRLRRDEMFHSLVALRDTMQEKAGFNVWFIELGGQRTRTKDYQLYRALQIAETIRVDENKRMREPPREAVFYLAEIHLGASYDLLIEGEYFEMGARLKLAFAAGGVSVGGLKSRGKYTVHARGLGLRPTTGDAIFAMTPDQIAAGYATTSDPVPVKLVFRTIPGRHFEKEPIAVPLVAYDDVFTLDEGHYRTIRIPAGDYRIDVTSDNHGVKLSWTGPMACTSYPDNEEWSHWNAYCEADDEAVLKVFNYAGWTASGGSETVGVYIDVP